MKATIYGQFVAGEDLDEIEPAINQLRENGVRAILDYAVEDEDITEKDVVMEARCALTYMYQLSCINCA